MKNATLKCLALALLAVPASLHALVTSYTTFNNAAISDVSYQGNTYYDQFNPVSQGPGPQVEPPQNWSSLGMTSYGDANVQGAVTTTANSMSYFAFPVATSAAWWNGGSIYNYIGASSYSWADLTFTIDSAATFNVQTWNLQNTASGGGTNGMYFYVDNTYYDASSTLYNFNGTFAAGTHHIFVSGDAQSVAHSYNQYEGAQNWYEFGLNIQGTPVPEPATMAGVGALCVGVIRRRKSRALTAVSQGAPLRSNRRRGGFRR